MAAPKLWKKDILLQAIKHRGGMTYGQIQQLAVLMAGLDYDEREATGRRKWRGFWSTNLARLLKQHCVKGPDRVYRLATAVDRPDERQVRSNQEFRRIYEATRRSMIQAGGRLPPGPFDQVRVRAIGWHPGDDKIDVTFEDSVGTRDVRWIRIRVPWPLLAGKGFVVEEGEANDGSN